MFITKTLDFLKFNDVCPKLLLTDKGKTIVYSYNISHERTGITSLLSDLSKEQILLKDIQTKQSSLEDIFVNIVKE